MLLHPAVVTGSYQFKAEKLFFWSIAAGPIWCTNSNQLDQDGLVVGPVDQLANECWVGPVVNCLRCSMLIVWT